MHLRDRLSIPDDAFVLQIRGSDSHPRFSVVVDEFLDAAGIWQRGDAALVVGSRTAIQADGSHSPFRDQHSARPTFVGCVRSRGRR